MWGERKRDQPENLQRGLESFPDYCVMMLLGRVLSKASGRRDVGLRALC